MNGKTVLLLLIALAVALSLQGCYYDVEEELYPEVCDLSQVTYTLSVKPILDSYCTGCHSTANAQGGVILDSYLKAKQAVDSRNLLGAIKHTSSFPMPKGLPKLSNCKISTIEKWINEGALNN